MISRKQIVRIHLIFWSVMLFIICLEIIPDTGVYSAEEIVRTFVSYILSFFLSFYIIYFSVSAKDLSAMPLVSVIAVRLLAVLGVTVLISFLFVFLFRGDVLHSTAEAAAGGLVKYYFSFAESNFLFAAGGGLIKAAILWYGDVMKMKDTEKRAAESELALLKSQINPGFLFGTLDVIEKLAGKNREKAIEGVENLAEIMSYMLYDTKARYVPLDSEINCIRHLLKLKGQNNGDREVRLELSGKTNGVKIAPLVLFPFVDCALGNCRRGENGTAANVRISASDSAVDVIIECPSLTADNQFDPSGKIKRILDLQYKDDYVLTTKVTAEKRTAHLHLKLNA